MTGKARQLLGSVHVEIEPPVRRDRPHLGLGDEKDRHSREEFLERGPLRLEIESAAPRKAACASLVVGEEPFEFSDETGRIDRVEGLEMASMTGEGGEGRRSVTACSFCHGLGVAGREKLDEARVEGGHVAGGEPDGLAGPSIPTGAGRKGQGGVETREGAEAGNGVGGGEGSRPRVQILVIGNYDYILEDRREKPDETGSEFFAIDENRFFGHPSEAAAPSASKDGRRSGEPSRSACFGFVSFVRPIDHAHSDPFSRIGRPCFAVVAYGEVLYHEAGTAMETRHTHTICPYCGCGCGLYLVSEGDTLTGTLPSSRHPVSRGSLCVKGWNSHEFVNHPARLARPLLREGEGFAPTDWDRALNEVATSLSAISKRHGPDSVAFLSSAKMTNEENYLMMKLARAVYGTNNIDHCARLCHASTVAGLAETFGSGAMTNSIGDFDEADLFLVIGSDTTAQHPLIGTRIVKSVLDRGAKLIVFDPRTIELVKYATLSARQRNGSDVALVNGLMNAIITAGLQDEAYIAARTEGFEELRKLVAAYTPERVEELSSVPARDLVEAARLYAGAKKAMIVYAMGITQHVSGVEGVQALANLAMLTGHVGFPGTGVNPLRGQNNVQGACDMGALPDVVSGYQKVADPAVREKFAKAWGVPRLPDKPGLAATEIMNGAAAGTIKAIYIVGENPAVSDPDTNHVRKALSKLEFLAVQDIFLTETARFAHVVLPASSFAEKDGTFTNTERRCQRVRKAVACPGEAREDWRVIADIARRAGYNGMNYAHPSEIMAEAASLTPIYGGISYDRLETFGLQWPCPGASHPGTPVLHVEKFTRGKGAFKPRDYKAPAETPDAEYPFVLSTGRLYWHWHTRSMTGRTSTLERESPDCFVEISPADAKTLGVRKGEKLKVSSRRGTITVRAEVTERVKAGSVYVPFHYGEAAANLLTIAALDPVAKIPEFKVCAVRLEKAGA